MDCSEYFGDWAALEYDVLGLILNKTVSLYDYLHFSLVCKSWNFIASRYKHQPSIITSKFSQLPMLIVPSKHGTQKQHSLYHLPTNHIRSVDFKFCFDKRCCGSSFGWLIMLEETLDITLFNPFLGSVIRFPAIDLYPDNPLVYTPKSIVRAIVTKDPSLYPNDYMVVVIYSSFHQLCLMKPNDKAWIYENSEEKRHYVEDVNVCDNTLYALAYGDKGLTLGKVEVENNSDDGSSSIIALKMVTPDFFVDDPNDLAYFAESSKKELLLIRRLFSIEKESEQGYSKIACVNTIKFLVYKLTHGMQRLVEVDSLDGDAMFIGDNQSTCVSTKDFPQCLPNRIYYTDSSPYLCRPRDVGIYNLEDKSFGKHYITDDAHKDLPPPIWIVPTICSKGFKE